MNDNTNSTAGGDAGTRESRGVPTCDNIRPLITSYMTHELGESQSALVREHIRLCPDCQAAAREIQQTLSLLSSDKLRAEAPAGLSDKRRAKIRRAYAHPIISWIETHHTLFSIMIALVTLQLVFIALIATTIMFGEDPEEEIPVNWVVPQDVRLDQVPTEKPQLTAAEQLMLDIPAEPAKPAKEPVIRTTPPFSQRGSDSRAQHAEPAWKTALRSRWAMSMLAALLLAGLWLAIRLRRMSLLRSEVGEDGVTDDGPMPFE